MSSSRLSASVELMRPFNVAVMMAVIAASALLSFEHAPDVAVVIVAAFAGGLIGAAANTINDYFDVEIDRINRPSRPLARKALSPDWAFMQWLVLSFVGISLNLFLHSLALWIAAGAVIVLYLYSSALKKTALWGNIAVSAMTGMALIYGAVAAGRPEIGFVPAIFAFLINLGREIIKDVEDMHGDVGGNARTFPIRFGVRKSLLLASVVLVFLIAATLLAYAGGLYGGTYLALVIIVDVVVLYVLVSVWSDSGPRNLRKGSTLLKLAMLIGLAALYWGNT